MATTFDPVARCSACGNGVKSMWLVRMFNAPEDPGVLVSVCAACKPGIEAASAALRRGASARP